MAGMKTGERYVQAILNSNEEKWPTDNNIIEPMANMWRMNKAMANSGELMCGLLMKIWKLLWMTIIMICEICEYEWKLKIIMNGINEWIMNMEAGNINNNVNENEKIMRN